jgi:hypothetical protein
VAVSFESVRVLLAIAALATAGVTSVDSQPSAPTDPSFQPGGEARAVAHMVGGIISYSRWPAPQPQSLRICTSGTTRFAAKLDEVSATARRAVNVRAVPAGSPTGDCDILYLGAMAPDTRLEMIRGVHRRAVLSIIETDQSCRSGAMICLHVRKSSVDFQLNIDAVSRSTVRIDPRVLLVAGGGGA